MLDLFLETMPCPHIPKHEITDFGRFVLMDSVHGSPPRALKGPERAPGGLTPGLRTQPFELFWRKPAIPNRVLQPLVPHKSGARLQIGSTHKIKPAGMSEHVRMNSQGREFGWQFEPVEHSPKGGRLHAEGTIRRAQTRLPQ